MPRTTKKRSTYTTNNGVTSLLTELWQAAVELRGSIEPADDKRYMLLLTFLRLLITQILGSPSRLLNTLALIRCIRLQGNA